MPIYFLFLIILATGDELVAGVPNGEPYPFASKAACEAQAAASKPELEAAGVPPFKLECRTEPKPKAAK